MGKKMKAWKEFPTWAKVLICIAGVVGIAGFCALFGFVLMLLWNSVIPAIIPGAPNINFWQTVGLFILAKCLFGCWHFGHTNQNVKCGCTSENENNEEIIEVEPEKKSETKSEKTNVKSVVKTEKPITLKKKTLKE